MKSRHFLIIAAIFWSLFGLVAGTLVWISMHDHGHNGLRLLGYFLVVWLGWLAPTYFIDWLQRRLPFTVTPRVIAVHVVSATAIAILHALYEAVALVSIRPYDVRNADWQSLNLGDFIYSRLALGWILYCLVLVGVLAYQYYQRYHERALQAAELERSLAAARLHALELQLQPHFLFNTLNAIAGLVRTNQREQAVTVIAGLADLLRYSLDHAGRQCVPLREEVDMLARYLDIERARFPDRMRFTITLSDEVREAAVPVLILQPLAENAVRHGIARLGAGGEISVDARRDGERLRISMTNSGRLDAAAVAGIGLTNTRDRLAMLYGDSASFELAASSESVVATLDLPFEVPT